LCWEPCGLIVVFLAFRSTPCKEMCSVTDSELALFPPNQPPAHLFLPGYNPEQPTPKSPL